MKKHRNSVAFKVYGKYALFSDPITQPIGEKFSYQVPTYQAVKGMLESVYWKPTFIWYIDAIRVIKRIQTESKGIRTLTGHGKSQDLSFYTYLKDVEYQVLAHFEWNDQRPELTHDRNEHKHHNMAQRSIKQGGRRDIFLGTRECYGYVEPCEFGEGEGFYDDYGDIDLGVMFHGFDYPDETGKEQLSTRLDRIKMENGVIKFTDPREIPENMRSVAMKDYSFKTFTKGVNFSELV